MADEQKASASAGQSFVANRNRFHPSIISRQGFNTNFTAIRSVKEASSAAATGEKRGKSHVPPASGSGRHKERQQKGDSVLLSAQQHGGGLGMIAPSNATPCKNQSILFQAHYRDAKKKAATVKQTRRGSLSLDYTVSDNDVVCVFCGQRPIKEDADRPGNRRFRAMLQAAIPRYMAPTVTKKERAAILRNIVHQVQRNGGRFIVKSKSKSSSTTSGGQQQPPEQQRLRKSTGLLQHPHHLLEADNDEEEESADYESTKFACDWKELDDLTARDRVGYALVREANEFLRQEEERKEQQKRLVLQQMRTTRQEGGRQEFRSIHQHQPNDDQREVFSLKTTPVSHDDHNSLKDLNHGQPLSSRNRTKNGFYGEDKCESRERARDQTKEESCSNGSYPQQGTATDHFVGVASRTSDSSSFPIAAFIKKPGHSAEPKEGEELNSQGTAKRIKDACHQNNRDGETSTTSAQQHHTKNPKSEKNNSRPIGEVRTIMKLQQNTNGGTPNNNNTNNEQELDHSKRTANNNAAGSFLRINKSKVARYIVPVGNFNANNGNNNPGCANRYYKSSPEATHTPRQADGTHLQEVEPNTARNNQKKDPHDCGQKDHDMRDYTHIRQRNHPFLEHNSKKIRVKLRPQDSNAVSAVSSRTQFNCPATEDASSQRKRRETDYRNTGSVELQQEQENRTASVFGSSRRQKNAHDMLNNHDIDASLTSPCCASTVASEERVDEQRNRENSHHQKIGPKNHSMASNNNPPKQSEGTDVAAGSNAATTCSTVSDTKRKRIPKYASQHVENRTSGEFGEDQRYYQRKAAKRLSREVERSDRASVVPRLLHHEQADGRTKTKNPEVMAPAPAAMTATFSKTAFVDRDQGGAQEGRGKSSLDTPTLESANPPPGTFVLAGAGADFPLGRIWMVLPSNYEENAKREPLWVGHTVGYILPSQTCTSTGGAPLFSSAFGNTVLRLSPQEPGNLLVNHQHPLFVGMPAQSTGTRVTFPAPVLGTASTGVTPATLDSVVAADFFRHENSLPQAQTNTTASIMTGTTMLF
ncbi:hypothetical protein ACA910_005196 [Epithemia clementina (nom. ined.)]